MRSIPPEILEIIPDAIYNEETGAYERIPKDPIQLRRYRNLVYWKMKVGGVRYVSFDGVYGPPLGVTKDGHAD